MASGVAGAVQIHARTISLLLLSSGIGTRRDSEHLRECASQRERVRQRLCQPLPAMMVRRSVTVLTMALALLGAIPSRVVAQGPPTASYQEVVESVVSLMGVLLGVTILQEECSVRFP